MAKAYVNLEDVKKEKVEVNLKSEFEYKSDSESYS